MEISIIGLDIAKHVFQVHGMDNNGGVVVRRQLRRNDVERYFSKLPPALVGIEACATAHHWARRISALGHDVRLMPPALVKPYVARGKKNDAADAAGIAEAVSRPQMRFVAIKSVEQQAVLMLHRTRDLLIRQRTMSINALRAHMAEFGLIVAQGPANVAKLAVFLESDDSPLPALARQALRLLMTQIADTTCRIKELEAAIVAQHKTCEASRNLATIPGIGPITASALAATVPDISGFRSGRHFAAWLGLVPSQNSSGGKDRLGGITKMGDRYLRRLLVIGATASIRHVKSKNPEEVKWLTNLLAHKPVRVASVALANKMARMAWAILLRGECYRPSVVA